MRYDPYKLAAKNNLAYSGDINLENGGTFFKTDLADFKNGFISAIRVTDLDSACGFDGAIMIELASISGCMERERIKSALQCCGMELHSQEWRALSPESKRLYIVESLLAYGYCDFDTAQIYQPDKRQPLVNDGWIAEYKSWFQIWQLLKRQCANL